MSTVPTPIHQPDPALGTVLRQGDRYVVHFVRDFDLPVEQLWAMLTEPVWVAGWLGRVERFEAVPGGAIDILLHPGKGAWLRGRVRGVQAPYWIEYDWHVPAHADVPAFTGSWLRLEVVPSARGARLLFSHSLPDVQRVLDILAASHLRLDLLPTQPGQLAAVDRPRFLAQRDIYARLAQSPTQETSP